MALFNFLNPYYFYYAKYRASGINLYQPTYTSIENIEQTALKLTEGYFDAVQLGLSNITASAASSMGMMSDLTKYAAQMESNEKALMDPITKGEYSKLKDRQKIIALTELYFTGSSTILSGTDKDSISITDKTLQNLNEQQSFVFLISSQQMKIKAAIINMTRGIDGKSFQGFSMQNSFKKIDKEVIAQLSQAFPQIDVSLNNIFQLINLSAKNPNISVQLSTSSRTGKATMLTNNMGADSILKNLSNVTNLESPQWESVKRNIKDIINRDRKTYKENLNIEFIFKGQSFAGKSSLTIAKVAQLPTLKQYKKMLCDGINKIHFIGKKADIGSLSLSGFTISNIHINTLNNLKSKATRFINNSPIFDNKIMTKDSNGNLTFAVNIGSSEGALGEMAALFGANSLLPSLQNNISLGGVKKNELGLSSMADIHIKSNSNIDNKKNIGLNIKRYADNKPAGYEKQRYKLFDDYLNLYVPKQVLLGMRYLELNWHYFLDKKIKQDGNISYAFNKLRQSLPKKITSLSKSYEKVGIAYMQNFIRQGAILENITNYFYVINNVVIPSSIILKDLANLLTTNHNQSVGRFIEAKSDALNPKIIRFAHTPAADINLLGADIDDFKTDAYLEFKGIKIKSASLTRSIGNKPIIQIGPS